MPEGPAAAPRRAHFRFFTNRSLSYSNANSGWWLRSASGNGAYGVVGRRTRSRNCSNVRCVPGANGAPSNAWRPEDTSPIMIKDWALSARRSGVSTWVLRRRWNPWAVASSQPADWINNCSHSPRENDAKRSTSRCFGDVATARGSEQAEFPTPALDPLVPTFCTLHYLEQSHPQR